MDNLAATSLLAGELRIMSPEQGRVIKKPVHAMTKAECRANIGPQGLIPTSDRSPSEAPYRRYRITDVRLSGKNEVEIQIDSARIIGIISRKQLQTLVQEGDAE